MARRKKMEETKVNNQANKRQVMNNERLKNITAEETFEVFKELLPYIAYRLDKSNVNQYAVLDEETETAFRAFATFVAKTQRDAAATAEKLRQKYPQVYAEDQTVHVFVCQMLAKLLDVEVPNYY
jgi:hypothetical protein